MYIAFEKSPNRKLQCTWRHVYQKNKYLPFPWPDFKDRTAFALSASLFALVVPPLDGRAIEFRDPD